jgi:cytochrome c oxidase assembly protein Cox11
MLALVTIFLTTFLIAFVAVHLYRAVAGWQGLKQAVVGRENKATSTTLKAQMGFITLMGPSRKKAKSVRLRSPKDGIKAPWGW